MKRQRLAHVPTLKRLPVLLRVVGTARHRDPTSVPECRQKSLPDAATKISVDEASWQADVLDTSLRNLASSIYDD
jgi:hypothetical protein